MSDGTEAFGSTLARLPPYTSLLVYTFSSLVEQTSPAELSISALTEGCTSCRGRGLDCLLSNRCLTDQLVRSKRTAGYFMCSIPVCLKPVTRSACFLGSFTGYLGSKSFVCLPSAFVGATCQLTALPCLVSKPWAQRVLKVSFSLCLTAYQMS